MILDGVGVGGLPDAAEYGDEGSDTLGNLGRLATLHLPNFRRLGLGNIVALPGVPPVETPSALPGRLAARSAGKDTTVGHWEHMGLVTEKPFPTYPQGFPPEVIDPLVRAIGRGVLGNKTASGTAILDEVGGEHLATGWPIVYTSVDSVFQVAAHIGIVPLETLYSWCEIARSILRGPHAVARVIARPFAGEPGAFVRTKDRRDFSLAPTGPTYLDLLQKAGLPVLVLGKIADVFLGRGVSAQIKVGSNQENLEMVRDLVGRRSPRADFDEGLLFTNLVDFDMVWGHRNDADGFIQGLAAVDAALPSILAGLGPDDRLLISADHGVDPTTPSTDHTREYVPLLLYPRPRASPDAVYEGGMADTGATVYRYLTGRGPWLPGDDIMRLRPGRGWRPYPDTLPVPGAAGLAASETADQRYPVRVGSRAAVEAGAWLRRRMGPAPRVALILGSGLAATLALPASGGVPFGDIPHWRVGDVPGHRYVLNTVEWGAGQVAVLAGRLHAYEGFDEGEVQASVRTLAAWGVERLIVTTASGAAATARRPGDVVVVTDILDFQHLASDGSPLRLPATGPQVALRLSEVDGEGSEADASPSARSRSGSLAVGVHACVPGPHYETAAELAVLRRLGAQTVSMSLASEVRAAHDTGLEMAALAAVVNVGDTSHQEVLAGALDATAALRRAITLVLESWEG